MSLTLFSVLNLERSGLECVLEHVRVLLNINVELHLSEAKSTEA